MKNISNKHFLLVPAHPGFPGQIPQSRKTVVCVCVLMGDISIILMQIGSSNLLRIIQMLTVNKFLITVMSVFLQNILEVMQC